VTTDEVAPAVTVPEIQVEEKEEQTKPEEVEAAQKETQSSPVVLNQPDEKPSTIEPPAPPPRRSVDARRSLDPASISPENLAQLRNALVAAQAENSRLQEANADLKGELEDTTSKLTDLETQKTFLSAAKQAIETQLQDEIRRRETAEENVEMLRSKVEDARKAIGAMRKGEDKRASSANYGGSGLGFGIPEGGHLSPDMGAQQEETSGKRVKRASVLFNQGAAGGAPNRRISSTGSELYGGEASTPAGPVSTARTGLRELKLGTIAAGSTASPSSPNVGSMTTPNANAHEFPDNGQTTPRDPRARSQTFNMTLSPSRSQDQSLDAQAEQPPFTPWSATSSSSRPRPGIAERLTSLTSGSDVSTFSSDGRGGGMASPPAQYVNLNDDDNVNMTLMSEVSMLKAQLTEAREARAASEECLKALREFIAMQNGGSTEVDVEGSSMQGIKLPPLPTDKEMDELEETLAQQEDAKSAKKSGWGFNIPTWAAPAPSATASAPSIHRPSRANSLATSIRSEAGDIPSADSSVRNAQLEPLRIGQNLDAAGNKPASASTTTPLSSFVASWSRGISGGAPASGSTIATPSGEPGTSPATAPTLAKRGFSFFGTRQKEKEIEVKQEAQNAAQEEAELNKAKQTPEEEMDKDENALRRGSEEDDKTRNSVEVSTVNVDEAQPRSSKHEKYETVAL
jgi:hypothetical protein